MGIVVSCQCGQRIEAEEGAGAQVATCPRCGAAAPVPMVRRAIPGERREEVERREGGERREGAPIRLVMATERSVTRAPRQGPGEIKVCCTHCGKPMVVCVPMPAQSLHCPHCGTANPVPKLVTASLPSNASPSDQDALLGATLVLSAPAAQEDQPQVRHASRDPAPPTVAPIAPVFPASSVAPEVAAPENAPTTRYIPPAESFTPEVHPESSGVGGSATAAWSQVPSEPPHSEPPYSGPPHSGPPQHAAPPTVAFGGELTPVQCGGCRNQFGAGPDLAGSMVHCPICGTPLAIPGPAWGVNPLMAPMAPFGTPTAAPLASSDAFPMASAPLPSMPLPSMPLPPRPAPPRKSGPRSRSARDLGGLSGEERRPIGIGLLLLQITLVLHIVTLAVSAIVAVSASAAYRSGGPSRLESSMSLYTWVGWALLAVRIAGQSLNYAGRGLFLTLRVSDSMAILLVTGSLVVDLAWFGIYCWLRFAAENIDQGSVVLNNGFGEATIVGATSMTLFKLLVLGLAPLSVTLLVLFLWRLAYIIEADDMSRMAVGILILLGCSYALQFLSRPLVEAAGPEHGATVRTLTMGLSMLLTFAIIAMRLVLVSVLRERILR